MNSSTDFLPSEIIKAKREGRELNFNEINFFINGYTKGKIPDYQMSALLMAIFFKGMSERETVDLTEVMLKSGETVRFSSAIPKIDKHSTGGVGDKTSLILGPIVAAAGVPVPMISGRGLGHTGGTLDKLESIPGFNTQLSLTDFCNHVNMHNICFIGQTREICPADKKIYALRDVTATVESLPLICASIMSKKLAEGIDGLVLDVKFGSGAFMKTIEQSEALARALMSIAKGSQKKAIALLTNMDQPLGRYAGNSLEVFECLEIMANKTYLAPSGFDLYEDTRSLSLWLAAHMLVLGGKAKTPDDGYTLAVKTLESGLALEKFHEICKVQGGDLSRLPMPKHSLQVLAGANGFMSGFATEQIGISAIKIKAGRASTEDRINPTAGIEFHCKIGDPIKAGEPIFTLWGDQVELFSDAKAGLQQAFSISLQKPKKQDLIMKTMT
ncbi:MAG: thymidine phosphorylase [Bdellovibrionaceae bacterium]|nr:thymidine phosphorylase [Pseudobdellovibrionaceae bacterium]